MQKFKPNLPPIEEEENRNKNPRIASIALKQAAEEMLQVKPYKTIKRGETPIRPKPDVVEKSTLPQRKRNLIHTLCRADENGNYPSPSNQKVPSYNGFHASLSKPQDVCKAYYVKSYDQPPNKSVVNAVMETQKKIMTSRNMPFSFLVGDLPVFNLECEIKAENQEKFNNLDPFLSPWHGQCVMMATIYTRYKGTEFEEILIQAGVVAPGSVDAALRGKHYRRGMMCLRKYYESLMRKLTKGN